MNSIWAEERQPTLFPIFVHHNHFYTCSKQNKTFEYFRFLFSFCCFTKWSVVPDNREHNIQHKYRLRNWWLDQPLDMDIEYKEQLKINQIDFRFRIFEQICTLDIDFESPNVSVSDEIQCQTFINSSILFPNVIDWQVKSLTTRKTFIFNRRNFTSYSNCTNISIG